MRKCKIDEQKCDFWHGFVRPTDRYYWINTSTWVVRAIQRIHIIVYILTQKQTNNIISGDRMIKSGNKPQLIESIDKRRK